MHCDKKKISRRRFLSDGIRTAAGLAAAGGLGSLAAVVPAGKVLGANDRINVAVIGIRSRGIQLARGFAEVTGVRVKTLCDVDENLFAERVKRLEETSGFAPSTEFDLRRIYDDKDIDAVVIATTDHWHGLATIWACQAGKHVYVEKPCSHNIHEGRKMVEAARKYKRIVAAGFHNRADRSVREAMRLLHSGVVGDVYMARGLCFKPRDDIGSYPDGPMRVGEEFYFTVGGNRMFCYDQEYLNRVHYDLWLGPAPQRPFNRNRFHYNWHWFWDYGCGDIGNQGPHQLDIARWGMGKGEHPVRVRSFGGLYAFKSAQQTPNTQVATYEYPDGRILQFEVRGLYTNKEAGIGAGGKRNRCIGNLFFGTKGWMALDGSRWATYFGRNDEPGPGSRTTVDQIDPMNLAGPRSSSAYTSFVNAIRSGKEKELFCGMEDGHISTVLPHLANISYRLGRELTFDGKKEKFVGDDEADSMLTRKYRKPYVVPDNV